MVQENIVIEMQNITKEFGRFKANDNINLQVKAGEIHVRCLRKRCWQIYIDERAFRIIRADIRENFDAWERSTDHKARQKPIN